MWLRRRVVLVAAMAALVAAPGVPIRVTAATASQLEQRYVITATLDLAASRLDAVVELELTNRSRAAVDHVDLAAVPRALGFLTLTGDVAVDGRAVEAEWTTSMNLRVPIPALERGGVRTIRVPFALDVARAPDAFTARTSAENGVLSFGQWFPIVSPEHDVYGIGDPQITYTAASMQLDLSTTAGLPADAVACPGLEEPTEDVASTWTCRAENVRDLSFVVNPRFRVTRQSAGDTAIRVYSEVTDGTATALLAADALVRLEEAFGPHPWPDLVLAEVGSATGFSMEYPRMIHLTRDKATDAYVVYHEVAHQWFYAQVGNDQQAEPWLDEAFADFSARYLLGIGESHCSTRPVDSPVFAWDAAPTSGGDWTSCDGYFHAVFYRGTEFITAVRSAMGDAAFFEAMRGWVARNRYGFATEAELLGHWSARSGADLVPIYERYLSEYEVAVPKPPTTLRRAV
jgi:hypothetical protein